MTILILAGIWIGVIWGFMAVMHAKRLVDSGKLTPFWKVHMYPLAVLIVLLDFVFNQTVGTLMFLEFPQEVMFSSRVQRHYRKSGGWRFSLAGFWARQLNAVDPNHITL